MDSPWKLEIGQLADQDWSVSWQQFFHTVRASDRVIIKPSWETYAPKPHEHVLEIDPGMSFGSGHHFTSRSCIRLMDDIARVAPATALCDLGCGSAILSIAAAKLGYSEVVAIDNNPSVMDIARENLEHNGVADRVTCLTADVESFRPGRKFDVVAANLYFNILQGMACAITDVVSDAPEGFLILAGILTPQYADVKAAYEKLDFKEIRRISDDEWTAGCFQLRPF
jgi:ribosomal protein L11 methyltransferase